MKKILLTGASGQIGSELTKRLRSIYGSHHVIATDIRSDRLSCMEEPYENVDVTNAKALYTVAAKYKVDTVIHLASLLSATAEANPQLAWRLNMDGLFNALEVARELGCQFFSPSSIGVFGPGSPKNKTPQKTFTKPITMYGINKLSGEMLCDYYFSKYGLDTRGLRFPGLVSYLTPPGGGTTDYAVEMYKFAAQKKSYTSYIAKDTYLDMMYMPDALDSIIQLMEANPSKLLHRNAYNVSAMSVDPEKIAESIRSCIPDFMLDYQVDPIRQAIAESWPNSLDTMQAEEEWGFKPQYDLERMTSNMLQKVNSCSNCSVGSLKSNGRHSR